MNTDQRDLLKCRLDCIIRSMLFQRSGADVHAANNIRHTAELLYQEVAWIDSRMTFFEAIAVLEKLEKQTTQFFKNKYGYFNR